MTNLNVDNYQHISVTPVAGSLGAEISGVDLSRDFANDVDNDVDIGDVVAEIRHAWLRHLVLFFRDQAHLESDDFLAFAKQIGTPVEYPFVSGHADHPEIISVTKLASETVNFGGIWHADTTYLDQPPMATMLIARELPPAGGDTEFANQYAAYEALSPAMQKMLNPLRAISSSALADVSKTREDRIRDDAEQGDSQTRPREPKVFEACHPVVRTHPETGRRALYVNVAHTARFDGMTVEESRPVLEFLFQHQIKAEFTTRFVWRPGSLALWDNRCVQHNPVNDYHGYKRVMHRITLQGDTPR